MQVSRLLTLYNEWQTSSFDSDHSHTDYENQENLDPFEHPLKVSVDLMQMRSFLPMIERLHAHPYAACIQQQDYYEQHKCSWSYSKASSPVLREHRRCDCQRH